MEQTCLRTPGVGAVPGVPVGVPERPCSCASLEAHLLAITRTDSLRVAGDELFSRRGVYERRNCRGGDGRGRGRGGKWRVDGSDGRRCRSVAACRAQHDSSNTGRDGSPHYGECSPMISDRDVLDQGRDPFAFHVSCPLDVPLSVL